MHPDFIPYPTSIPPAVLSMVIDALRGNPVDAKEAAHAVYHVIGYGLSKWDTHLVGASGETALTNAAAAMYLEKLLPVSAGVTSADDEAGVPWALIVPMLIELVKLFFRK